MVRPIRFQYPGAIYHVMTRGDGGRVVFETDDDKKSFVFRLGQVCANHGWRVHAWVLMGNHFHLLLETPQENLVTGMQWLLGTSTHTEIEVPYTLACGTTPSPSKSLWYREKTLFTSNRYKEAKEWRSRTSFSGR